MSGKKGADVLIVGGGVAGLTAAVALAKHGIDAKLYERADDLRKLQQGSGLFLGYNVSRAFRHLGMEEELEDVCASVDIFEYATERGRVLGTVCVPAGERQLGIIRSELHQLLVDAIEDGVIETDAWFTRFEQDSDGVTAYFKDGKEARGDVLIGADGINSTVRLQLEGGTFEPPLYAGYTARRGVVATDIAKEGRFRMSMGRGRRFVFYPVAKWKIYWSAIVTEPPGVEDETQAEMKQNVQELFADFAEPIPELVEQTEEALMFGAEIHDRDPVERWGEGRVTRLGDSGNPMTFNVGQGAGQSIEGALKLARCLKEGWEDPAAALRAYESERIPRTTKFVELSRRVGRIGQWDNPVQVFFRNNVFFKVMARFANSERAAGDLKVDY